MLLSFEDGFLPFSHFNKRLYFINFIAFDVRKIKSIP
jgi:hypothetical protein